MKWFFSIVSRETVYGQSVDIFNADQKTYYYTMDWRDKLVDSSLFYIRSGHENPKEFPIKNRVQTANHVLIADYELGAAAKAEITNYIEITSDTRPEDPAIKMHSGLYYHCNDVFNPEVGDIRLQFLTAGIEGNFVIILISFAARQWRVATNLLPIWKTSNFSCYCTLLAYFQTASRWFIFIFLPDQK